MPSTPALRLALALVPMLALGACTSPDADQPEAEPAERETDPTVKPEVEVSPDLRDPFKKDGAEGQTGEGAGETGEDYGTHGLARARSPRDGGGVSERVIEARVDKAAEADEPAEGSKQPNPDLEDPFDE